MDAILQMILEIVREQQRDAASLSDTMTKAEVVDLTMSMMEQQQIDEYHEDLEADIYNRIQYLAPRLFEHEELQKEEEQPDVEKYSYRMRPSQEILDSNENLALDLMVGDGLQALDSPVEIDTLALDYEQAYEQDTAKTDKEEEREEESLPTYKEESSSDIDEETLNQLVLAKYRELSSSENPDLNIDSGDLASLVMQALQGSAADSQNTGLEDNKVEEDEEVDTLLQEIWSTPDSTENALESQELLEEIFAAPKTQRSEAPITSASQLNQLKQEPLKEEEKNLEISSSKLYHTKSYMTGFTQYLENIQDNKKLDTGFSSLDRILETGLQPGLYLLHSDSVDLSAFRLQMADQMSSLGFPVCYLLFHHSKYECMAKSLSRLTYELRGEQTALSLAELYKKQENSSPASLEKELSYYEDNIAENLYFTENSFFDTEQLITDIQSVLSSFENFEGKKPIFILDELYHCKDKTALLSNLAKLCSDKELTLIVSLPAEESSNLDDYSSIELTLSKLSSQDSFTKQELILESGAALTVDVSFTDASSKVTKKCQLLSIPKFHCFKAR